MRSISAADPRTLMRGTTTDLQWTVFVFSDETTYSTRAGCRAKFTREIFFLATLFRDGVQFPVQMRGKDILGVETKGERETRFLRTRVRFGEYLI